MEKLKEIQKKLHEINFGENGIVKPIMANGNVKEYSFNNLKQKINGNLPMRCHEYSMDCANNCEDKCYCDYCSNINPIYINEDCEDNINEKEYRFSGVSHGAYSLDFFEAHEFYEYENWSKKPVLFVFENPGNINYGAFGSDGINKPTEMPKLGNKYPTRWWYWINGQDNEHSEQEYIYPNFLVQKEYGRMIYSLLKTFKIANAYVTNMVKCGIASCLSDFVNTSFYNSNIVDTCIEKHLKREINALRNDDNQQNITIFAFGERVYYKLKDIINSNEDLNLTSSNLFLLPHPASRLANDYRKYVLLGKIMCGLMLSNFYCNDNNEPNCEKPEMEEILLNDKSEQQIEEMNDIEQLLKAFGEEKGVKFDSKIDYVVGEWGYNIKYNYKKDGGNVKSINLWYGLKDEEKIKKNNKNSWVSYSFNDNELSLYISPNKSNCKHATELVCENYDAYPTYKMMKEFLNEKMNICGFTIKKEMNK